MKTTNLQTPKKVNFSLNLLTILAILVFFSSIVRSQDHEVADFLRNCGYSSSTDIKNITEVNLSGKKLSSVPEEIFEMTSLETLDLHNNPIENLPADIHKLQYLRTLNLADTQIETLPDELSMLLHLQEIHLSYLQWEYKLDIVKSLTNAKIILE